LKVDSETKYKDEVEEKQIIPLICKN